MAAANTTRIPGLLQGGRRTNNKKNGDGAFSGPFLNLFYRRVVFGHFTISPVYFFFRRYNHRFSKRLFSFPFFREQRCKNDVFRQNARNSSESRREKIRFVNANPQIKTRFRRRG